MKHTRQVLFAGNDAFDYVRVYTMLGKDDLIRYSRQLSIKGWSRQIQEKLKGSTVFIAGAGGLGSPVLLYLASAGVGRIRICDYDRVELSNLNRQILHSDRRIGRYKVKSAEERVREINPNVEIIPLREKISRKNTKALIEDADVLLDCLDNYDARHHLNRIAVYNALPLIHAGIEAFRGQITFLHPPETSCLACFIPRKIKKESVPVLGATAGVIGALQATEAIKYLVGLNSNLKDRLLIYDGLAMTLDSIRLKRNPKCRICGAVHLNRKI